MSVWLFIVILVKRIKNQTIKFELYNINGYCNKSKRQLLKNCSFENKNIYSAYGNYVNKPKNDYYRSQIEINKQYEKGV